MNDLFTKEERLYRAVRPDSLFWKENGKLSSAAFKDKNGLSVERGDFRTDNDVILHMKNLGFRGKTVSVQVYDCYCVQAIVKYLPVDGNEYHSEIHRNLDIKPLSKSQAKFLSESAVVVGEL